MREEERGYQADPSGSVPDLTGGLPSRCCLVAWPPVTRRATYDPADLRLPRTAIRALRRGIAPIFGYDPLVRLPEPLPHVLSSLEAAVISHRHLRPLERPPTAARAPRPARQVARTAADRPCPTDGRS